MVWCVIDTLCCVCVYYSRSDARATWVVTTLPIVCLILDQLDASMDALPKVVCESDADSNGEGDGEKLLHGRMISDGLRCSKCPKWERGLHQRGSGAVHAHASPALER